MRIITGIASTTHVDRHNDKLTKGVLDSMSEQIREKYIPNLVEHDWNEQIGVILYGEVFQLDDGEYALGIVAGIFERESERWAFRAGMENTVWETYRDYLNIGELRDLRGENGDRVDAKPKRYANSVAGRLERHLDSTGVMPDGTVYSTKLLVTSVNDLRIEVYPHDHAPDHFHVVSRQRGIDARFSMETLEFLSTKRGRISPNDIRKIHDYFHKNPQELETLMQEHKRLNPD